MTRFPRIPASLAILASAPALGVPPDPVPPPSVGPDLVMSGLGSGNVGSDNGDVNGFGVQSAGTIGDVSAFVLGTVACNIGDADLSWFELSNQHPLFGTQGYRYRVVDGSGRFEQVGMSWLKHAFCGADAARCTELVFPLQIPRTQPDCDGLGPFRTDVYGSALNAAQSSLGPRSEVNPWTGVYPFPYQLQAGQTGSAVFKRMQIAASDLVPGDTYVFETVGIAPNETAANRNNNYSYRFGTFSAAAGGTFTLTGPTYAMQPAIHAWRAIDPSVTISTASPSGTGDGRVVLASRVTQVASNLWHFEYALFNMNFNAGIGRFGVPMNRWLNSTNAGFHAPLYHSGEPYDNTPWASSRTDAALDWVPASFPGAPHNGAAVRWGTTANFRFDADAPPTPGTVTVEVFNGGLSGATVFTMSAAVPGAPPCPADLNGDGATNTPDLTLFLGLFGQHISPPGSGADFNADGTVNTPDLTAFLGAFGCPG